MVLVMQVDLLLRGLKEGFAQLLTAAGCVPTLVGEQPEAQGVQQQTTTTVFIPLPRCIIENKEPFAHVEWRKAPYDARAYQELTDYEIRTNDPNEVRGKRGRVGNGKRSVKGPGASGGRQGQGEGWEERQGKGLNGEGVGGERFATASCLSKVHCSSASTMSTACFLEGCVLWISSLDLKVCLSVVCLL